LSRFPEDAFRRTDETPDEEFYRTPRLVTHIDEGAIAAVTQLYRDLFPAGGEVLDLMSSLVSHPPPEVELKCCKQLSPAQGRACLRSVRVETIGRSLEECNPGICVIRT
jgi:hypothetical protein